MSLDAAFSAAIDTLYAADGHVAEYVPACGPTAQITVLRSVALAASQFDGGVVRGDDVLHVRRSQVPQPARGDVVTIGEECWTVQDAEPVDGNRWEWRLVVRQ